MLRPEPHVAQHSRREKLRVHPSSSPSPPLLHPLPPQLDFHAAASVPASCSNSSSSFLTQFDAAGGMWKPDWLLNNCEDLHLPSFPYSPYPLHDVVTSSLTPPQPPMLDSGSELLLLPSFGNSAPSVWTPAAAPGRFSANWNGAKHEGHDQFSGGASAALAETQGLSLTLSSNPPPEIHVAQFEQNARIGLGCGGGADRWAAGGCSSSFGGARQAAVGPLGPFTGYAAILKSSKFLKPAQKVLDEFCSVVSGSRMLKQYDAAGKILEGDGGGFEDRSSGRCGNSGASSSSFHSSTEVGGGRGCAGEVYRPEFEEKKAKLLYMQEEVCRRYKQYHQQMQMVVSSFETVAGLSTATPYTTLALKAVSKHFRFLKNAISDQLRHVCKVLGEELMASSPSSGRSDKHITKLKYIDQTLRRQRAGDSSMGFSDNNHPIWRPQRGLPERAVSVLRAWLFDHFLHPYPTDTDKHMLATQTGLSRNQVSNWFINARVRLWKPMVEEIHMLETKGMSGMDLNCMNKSTEKATADQRSESQLNKPVDCAVSGQMTNENSSHCVEQLHQEKRSRMEDCAIDAAGLMSFAYPGAMDIGGLGAVSLTLGLRQDEGMQQQQQQIRHFGHQMLHDFVG